MWSFVWLIGTPLLVGAIVLGFISYWQWNIAMANKKAAASAKATTFEKEYDPKEIISQ